MNHVLIVDEEEHLLWALEQNLFQDRNDTHITSCTTGEEALEKLQSTHFDLLVCDIKMPGKIDGFQLILRAKEIASDAKVIIMTAFDTQRIQSFAEKIGVTHYVEKPFNTVDLRNAILEALDEKEGFSGVLNELDLTDIVQMLCLSNRSALLHLKHKENRGRIVFERGEIVHAIFNDVVGDDAFYEMLALKNGDIFMEPDYVVEARTITLRWQDLLFEGVRLSDEARASDAFSIADVDDFPIDDERAFFGSDYEESSLDSMTSIGVGPDDSFFSDAELREIESIGLKEFSESISIVEENNASLEEVSSEVTKIISDALLESVVAEEAQHNTNDFSGFDPFEEKEIEYKSPFSEPESSEYKSIENLSLVEIVTPGEIQTALEELAKQCTGVKLVAVLSPADGVVLNSVDLNLEDPYDAEGIAPFISGIVKCAQQTVDIASRDDRFQELQIQLGNEQITVDIASRDDRFQELQIQLGNEQILIRVLAPTQCVLITVLDRSAPLGLVLVHTKKFQGQLLAAAKL